jgi:hypothetical protein
MQLCVKFVFAVVSGQAEKETKQYLTLAHRKIQIKTILTMLFVGRILNFLAYAGYNPYNVCGLCHKVRNDLC